MTTSVAMAASAQPTEPAANGTNPAFGDGSAGKARTIAVATAKATSAAANAPAELCVVEVQQADQPAAVQQAGERDSLQSYPQV